MEPLLNTLVYYYYNAGVSTSFRRPDVIYRRLRTQYPGLKKEQIIEWYRSQKPYLVYKTLRRKYPKNPIVSKRIDHIWNIDLIELAKPEVNDNFRYFLTVIDNLSKYAWVKKLKNKRRGTVLEEFRQIIENSGRKPEIIGCDTGPEFNNNLFKEYLEQQNIALYLMFAPDKAVLAERFNQTLKFLIYRYLYLHKTDRYIDVVDNLVDNYNNTIHSRTLLKPVDVTEENQKQAFRNLYRNSYRQREKQKFFVGDKVLIPYYINLDPTKMTARFKRLKYKDEVYTISKVLYSSPRFKYLVKDSNGETARNSFYADQLVKTNLNEQNIDEEEEEDEEADEDEEVEQEEEEEANDEFENE